MNTGDESYYVSKFGKDVAIAFALLGDLNKFCDFFHLYCSVYITVGGSTYPGRRVKPID
jgi:hypothetical protein